MADGIDINLFGWLVRYHIENNLKNGLENEEVINGVMYFQGNNGKVPVKVGKENGQHWYNGFLLFANGNDIIDHLRMAGIIPKEIAPAFVSVNSMDKFSEYLNKNGDKDGAFVYDNVTKRITRVKISNNNPSLEGIVVENMLPLDFLSEDKSVTLYDEDGFSNVGCRSDVAVKTSRGFDYEGKYHSIDAYLIKHTIYNKLGFGPVVHMYKDGMEMFSFRYAPENEGPFINEEHKIAGVYKNYGHIDGRFSLNSGKIVAINEDGKLVYSNNKLVFPGKNA